jgi:hypothetical protein
MTFASVKNADWEYGVRALAHTDLKGKVDGVYRIELDVVLGDVSLRLRRLMLAQLFFRPLAVYEENAAGLHVIDIL